MLGLRSSYGIITPFLANLRQRMHFGYLQDDIKVNSKLTLNVGLRYEYATPQYEKDNFLTNFDPATNTLIAAKDGSIYDRALVNPDRNNFAPRLGAAWAVDDKTVVRAGYGISYIHFNRMGGENLLSFNGPHVVGLSINQTTQPAAVRRQRQPDDLLPDHAAGLSRGLHHAGQLQSAERARELHPEGHADRQRARAGTRRSSARSSATCWSTSATSATRAATS